MIIASTSAELKHNQTTNNYKASISTELKHSFQSTDNQILFPRTDEK